jgi:hypothetical protein
LIIDEIDGVFDSKEATSAIDLLLKLISNEKNNFKKKDDNTIKDNKKKKRFEKKKLMRPIICICNDQ